MADRCEPSVQIRVDPDTHRRLRFARLVSRTRERTTIRKIASDAIDAWLHQHDITDPTEPVPDPDAAWNRSPPDPAPPPDPAFQAEFDAAYNRLSAELSTRFVPVVRLRAAMTHRTRETFERELVALCWAHRFQLSGHEPASRLPPADRAVALQWAGRAYYFVSRV